MDSIEVGIAVVLIGLGIMMAGMGISASWPEAQQTELSQALEGCNFGCNGFFDYKTQQECFLKCIKLIDLNGMRKNE